ncbi:MAG: Asp-tRNA(Asn)/Glu-tRNA(Gln) amidotransferase subunit GatC [Nanoarchaeota archaeon]|nr:Asp-tRNA(Asn)/Glu-tRNA(Gln) amidotransferase subunit GatC [Nanoarchaeota archaeon]
MKVAKSARLDKDIEDQLKKILEDFKLLEEVETDNIEPSFQPFEIKNILREDAVEESLSQEDALKNAEQKQDKFFKGPRAV